MQPSRITEYIHGFGSRKTFGIFSEQKNHPCRLSGYASSSNVTAMSTLASRLRARMQALNLTQEDLANRLDVSQTTISKLVVGKTERPRNILELAKALQTSPNWLLFGRGPIDADHDPDRQQPVTGSPVCYSTITDKDLDGYRTMPVHGDVFADPQGELIWTLEDDRSSIPFPHHWFSDRQLDPELCQLLRVQSDALSPEIRTGDIVMINIGGAGVRIQDGRPYAIMSGRELFLRRVYRTPSGGILARADQPGYPVLDIPPPMMSSIQIVGPVVYRAG